MEFKDKRLIIILVLACVVVWGVNVFVGGSRNSIDRFLTNRGFYLDNDGAFYYKQISDTTIKEYEKNKNKNIKSSCDYMYFDKYNFKLNEVINEYDDRFESSLNLSYKFSNDKISYVYRIDYGSSNIIIKGFYDDKSNNFTCKKELSNNIKIDDKQDICDNALYYAKAFYKIKDSIFKKDDIKKFLRK